MVFLDPIHLAKADTLPNPMVVATQVGDTTKRACSNAAVSADTLEEDGEKHWEL